ncbi:metalloregulator ArsR/SmtB family transcription factor [Alkalihalobacillus sp. AL-G]|uniref:metalloregulator ArsR/SmtB family transcription factor n=1 Tax=Alkalihalobacillus sp. AL-G TaxID=2926399 RepID=UPI00272A6129|nr:metalloregulator ArsR/SmtB family transcription factor [Alkalihalobacillus sp. AL-G]WLD91775.1 metalloregulator ArsR/SmtB family transcription factor [Alkalihalobacillus sp. AL-G]
MESNEVIDIFKALAHHSRVEILDYLKNGPMTTGELSEKFNVSRYAVMKHLDILESAGLIVVRRKGRIRLNFINAIPLQQLYNRWVSKYESQFSSSLVHLKNQIEEKERGMNMENKVAKLEVSWFQIEQEVSIQAPKERVFQALTEEIDNWWAFRLSDKDSKLVFEPNMDGRFYEDWGDGHGAVWGTVLYIKENEEIRLNGLLGMKGAVNSHYTYKLEEHGSSTVLKLTHDAVGLLDPEWEEAHRHGWVELLEKRLKEYVEKGE